MNRTTPGDVLNEFSETYCNPRNKYFVQDCLIFIVEYVLFIFIVEYVPSCKLNCYTEEIKRIGDQSSLTAEKCSGH